MSTHKSQQQTHESWSELRKQAQKEGLIPEWYTTQGYQLFSSKYAVEGEQSLLGRHRTIAKTLAQYMVGEEEEWEELFFNELWDGILSPATPALANTGTNRGMNVSCSGQYIGDSVLSFYEGLKELAILSKWGFGTSADFSGIRPRGAPISRGGDASGPVPVMEDFFTAASKISQGGNRRGAVGAYLDIEHPDWDEAVDLLNREPDGKNFGWTVRDSFINKLKEGDAEAHRKFNRAMYTKLITGKGYFFFVDKANRQRPQMYKDLGLDIKATNLCVAPETLVLTDKGHKEIQSMAGTKQKVWNGHEWSEVEIVKTGENQKLLKVTTNSGHVLECTPYHKWYVELDGEVKEVRTKDLNEGDTLIQWTDPQGNQFKDSISSVVDEGRISDTYCFTEPKRHMGVFNGILTGQCSEIMLHSSEEYTYSCILASMNLVNWEKMKERNSVFIATVFLDCLAQDFIENSEGIEGLEKVREFTIKGRAIGLGAMGFHTYLQSKGIPYESLEAQFLSNEMAKHIHDESLRASQWLAEKFGEPEWCKGYGVRNTHRTAYAPTKSTALLMGGVSESWSPDPGMVFDMASAVGELRRIPPMFYEKMKEKGVYNEDTIRDIINHLGSVQHVTWLTPAEKAVFRNAYEVDQRVILRHASARQKYTCQGQSLNFFVSEEGSESLIAEVMTRCFLDENILSQYYFYSKSGVIVPDECLACAA